MTTELQPSPFEDADSLERDLGLIVTPFFEDIGVPSKYIGHSQEVEKFKGETYFYSIIIILPEETQGGMGELHITATKHDVGRYAFNEMEYFIEKSARRFRNPFPIADGEEIAELLKSHQRPGTAPKYMITNDRDSGITRVTYPVECWNTAPLLDSNHRFVGLHFEPNLGEMPPIPNLTMGGYIELLAVPAVRVRRSRLAIASGIPRG